ncbi:DNA repair exonuclease [Siccirubricoccus sp. KC 17139]|uniref:DNA repair exonuclease n=1 Tax=Siccirubricoccus soli TaxID=2899147 RepID=A0ABT1CY84_9PROT|nr:DNA repair exonuclease [Siccirubricoccus soli]MCO6414626.1 DNA repair exonuclease [Siccirubricoccus soli]MCP2680756.1 DNA repair exonuclease [Siccirubricoccus soli]
MRFIHAADLHLDSPLTGLRQRAQERASHLADASRRALEQMVTYALEERIDLVVVAGDLFDTQAADFNSALFLLKQLARLSDADIPVALIRGNHDAANAMSRKVTWPKNVHEFGARAPATWEIPRLEVAVHGQSFPHREVPENLVLRYPAPKAGWFNIGLLHTSLDGRPGHAPYAPCSVQDLRNRGYDYWALGHVHGHEVVDRNPHVIFSGNLQGRHSRECGPKGFVVATVEGGRVSALEHVPIDVVRWARLAVDVSSASTVSEVCPLVSAALMREVQASGDRTLAVRIVLEGACPAHVSLAGDPTTLLAECTGVALQCGGDVWIEKVEVRTSHAAVAAAEGQTAAFAPIIKRIGADEAELGEILAPVASGLSRLPPEVLALLDVDGRNAEGRDRLLALDQASVLRRITGRVGA